MTNNIPVNIIEDRLVQLAFNAVNTDDYTEIIRLAEASGYKYNINPDSKQLTIHGQVTTAIYPGLDPVTMYVCLCFAFIGQLWTEVCPNGINKINRLWKEKIKKLKPTTVL